MSWFDDLTPDDQTGLGIMSKFLSAGVQYEAASQKAAAEQKWQAYQNTMVNLSNAQNQNAITHNEEMAVQQAGNQRVNIQRGGIINEAKVQVQAAASGVAGKSVTESIIDVHRNADQREQESIDELNNNLLNMQNQRATSEFEAAIKQNYSYIPTPSAGDALLGAIEGAAKFVQQNPTPINNPVGQQVGMQQQIVWDQ